MKDNRELVYFKTLNFGVVLYVATDLESIINILKHKVSPNYY